MNALPCLKVLDLRSSELVRSMMMGLATGGSPLLERLTVIVSEYDEIPGVVAALEQRSLHEACTPLCEFKFHQYIEDDALLNRLFACRILASVDNFSLGGHGRAGMKAFVMYLEEGLKQGQPRGVKRFNAEFFCQNPDGNAELLMDVLARGGAPNLEKLGGLCEGERDGVYWSPQAKWLFNNKVAGQKGACPRLTCRVPW